MVSRGFNAYYASWVTYLSTVTSDQNMHIMQVGLLIRLDRLLIESPGLLIKTLNQYFEPEKGIMHP